MMNLLRFCFIVSMGFILVTSTGMAAPPPTEVEERKNEAAYHLIGTVTADEMFKDISQKEHYPQQVRRMSIDVDRHIKFPDDQKEKSSIEVFYWYIPSWQSKEYKIGRAHV